MKPKVLFVMHMPPPVHGASMMGKYIHDSKLVNEEFECKYINMSTSNKLNDIGKISIQKFLSFCSLLKVIEKRIKEFSPDLICLTPNASGIAFFKDFLIIQFIKCYSKNIVVHYHNKGISANQNKWLYNKLYKIFFEGLKVILLAKELYPDISKYVRSEDVYYCANGIPTMNVSPLLKEEKSDIFRFLFLSNMMRSKGVYTLINACALLKKIGFDFICAFVGDWKDVTEADFRKKIEALRLANNVIAVGPKYGDDKEHFLSEANCFVFPSAYNNEAFSLVLLEAMQHRLPCISTYEGGIPSIVNDKETGFLVEAHNEEKLCSKMKWMIENPDEAKKMGNKGWSKFQQEYTLGAFEQRFVNILRTLTC